MVSLSNTAYYVLAGGMSHMNSAHLCIYQGIMQAQKCGSRAATMPIEGKGRVCKNVERLRWGQESRSGADGVRRACVLPSRACALQPLSQDCLGGGCIRLLHHIAATLVINGL